MESFSSNVFELLKIASEIINYAHKFKSCISESLLLFSNFDQEFFKCTYEATCFHDMTY